jgi:hypothetical protein
VPAPEDVKDAAVEKLWKDRGSSVERRRSAIFFSTIAEQNPGLALC